MNASPDERFLAGVIADALAGRLHLGLADLGRVMAASSAVNAERLAPLALALWLERDARAADLIRRLLGRR